MAISSNAATLEAMLEHMFSLNSTSSISDLEHFTTFFSPTATAYLNGMGQPPCTSHAELITTAQTIVSHWTMVEHKNVTHIEQEDGKIIVNTTENKLRVLDEVVEGFKECEVVTFGDDGKIERYELYVDPRPVIAVFAKANAGRS